VVARNINGHNKNALFSRHDPRRFRCLSRAHGESPFRSNNPAMTIQREIWRLVNDGCGAPAADPSH